MVIDGLLFSLAFSRTEILTMSIKKKDEINEQTENLKWIQEALSAPIVLTADFDKVYSCVLVFSVFLID